nr:methyltransferase [Rhodococcus sp. 06-1059B-a]
MTSVAPQATEPTGPTIAVEIRSLDQHHDPGFLHYRGAFYTHTAAARFALTQSAALSESRGVPEIAVSIIGDIGQAAGTNVEFIGSPAEMAGELASNRNYAPGVRRTVLPPPAQVTAAVDAAVVRTPPPGIDLNRLDAVEVEVYSTRPDPLPNSRTEVGVGVYDHDTAHVVASELAEQVGGQVMQMRADTVLRVVHTAELSEVDREAAARYTRVEELRANLSTLDPVVDAEHITALAQDLDELRGRTSAPVSLDGASASTPTAVRDAQARDVVAGDVEAPSRPRGLVSAPPGLSTSRRSPTSEVSARVSPPVVHSELGRDSGYGLG